MNESLSDAALNNLPLEMRAAYRAVVAEIERRLAQHSSPLVVALDGGSGAGKSTLAALVAKAFDTALIPLDDFYRADIPDVQWDRFTVVKRLAHVFNWRRLREQVIKPLREGRTARWHAFDFARRRPDGTYGMLDEVSEQEPAEVILIEGAYAASAPLADLVDLAILVDVPVEERHARLQARQDAAFLQAWHQRWDAVEHYYFTQVRPKDNFDLVVRPR